MKKFSLVQFSVEHPRIIVLVTIIITLAFATQFPKVKTDTNPKNMLPGTSDVRVWNDEVEKTFGLYEDMIVVGIVNEKGILNRDTLGKIYGITNEILKLKGVAARDVNSFPTITNVTSGLTMPWTRSRMTLRRFRNGCRMFCREKSAHYSTRTC